jgi:hypothetical protein
MMEKNQVIPINQDEVQIYLKELRRIKVMTPERERELSAKMQTLKHLILKNHVYVKNC